MARRAKLLQPIPVLGLDVSQPGEYIAARATSFARNVRIKRSLIQKRQGTEALGLSLGERVQRLIELETGEDKHFYRIGPTKFEELNKTSNLWENRAHAALTSAPTDMVSATFPLLTGKRILVYTNGVDVLRKCDGTGNDAELGGSPPLARFCIYYGGYLVLAFITDTDVFPWRVQWCDTGTPEVWTGGNAGSQELLEDSADITGIGYYGQYFTIHKENAIYVGYLTQASTVFTFERKETGAGTVAALSIQTLPTGEQAFLARDGIRLFNGITAPLIESPMNDEIRDFLNPEHAYKSWSKVVREQDEYWVAVPLGDDQEPSTIYKFNYVTRQVHVDQRDESSACGDYKNTTGQIAWDSLPSTWDAWIGPWDDIQLSSLNPLLVFGFVDGTTTRQNSASSDNGAAIEGTWDSKDFTSYDFGIDVNKIMEWEGANIWAKGNGNLEIWYSIDSGSSWISAGTIAMTSDYPPDSTPMIAYFHVVSVRLRLRLRNQVDGETFEIKQFGFVAVPMDEENN